MLLLQSASVSTLFAIALIIGGVLSMGNARNVQHKYLDFFDCALIDDYPADDIDTEIIQKLCHDLEKLKRCQIASAVS